MWAPGPLPLLVVATAGSDRHRAGSPHRPRHAVRRSAQHQPQRRPVAARERIGQYMDVSGWGSTRVIQNLDVEVARSAAVRERQELVMSTFDSGVAENPAMSSFESEIGETARWLASPRFEGITRLYSPRQVVEQRGNIPTDYTVARVAAGQFYDRLPPLLAPPRQNTPLRPPSPP